MCAFAVYHDGWQSAALLCATFCAIFALDFFLGKKTTDSFCVGILFLAFGIGLLNSVFNDMITALKISFGFVLLNLSLDCLLEAFEKPIQVWLRFRGKKKTASDNESDNHEARKIIRSARDREPQVSEGNDHENNEK